MKEEDKAWKGLLNGVPQAVQRSISLQAEGLKPYLLKPKSPFEARRALVQLGFKSAPSCRCEIVN